MTIAEILEKLQQNGIELWNEGDDLRFRAPKGALTPELRNLIVTRKPDLLTYLREQSQQAISYSPLSFGQQSMWFIHQMSPESAAYNVAFPVRICSPIVVDVLRRTLQTIVDRHPLLRTTYLLKDDVPVQAIHGTLNVNLETVDASGMTSEELDEAIKHAYEEPFDLEHGPIIRAYLFTRASDEHIFLLVTHHIAVDGWSIWLLLDDFHALYPAYLKGESVSLPRPESTYSDYAGWLNSLITGTTGDKLRNYWRTKLSDALTPLNVPTDHPRPPIMSFNGASHVFVIDESLSRRLREQAKAESTTLYVLLLAAFQVLLYRYSGQEQILVGSPMFGRNRPEFAAIVGHFVNMVTLRGDFAGSPTFKQVLASMRQTVLEALDHQEYPLLLLAQELDYNRDLSRSAIFQVMFDLQRLQQNRTFSNLFLPDKIEADVDLGGLRAKPYLLHQQEGQFDLSLQIAEIQDTLPASFKYNPDLFDLSTIERMGQHFVTLLGSILDNMDTPVDQLRLMPDEERQQILVDWNNTKVDYPQDQAVHQLFEAQVERTPDATAAIFEAKSLTYRQLNQRANQLAHYLRSLNVAPDTLVGICMDRSLDMLVALLGVLKAGGAYVPMDPEYPQERLGYMVEDARMPIIITQQTLIDRLPDNQAQIIRMDSDWDKVGSQPQDNPAPQQKGDNLAYVIFTSGSTGRPKGVQLPHRALTNFLLSTQREPGMRSSDVLVSVTTLSFDIAGLELYLPLISGAAVVIASRDTAIDGVALAALLESSNATVMQATPATWRVMIDSGWKGRAGLKMLCGGEGLPRKLMDQLLERGAELWNMYGPTETTIWSTVSRLQPSDPIITIGRPMANTQVYVLNNHLAPVPVGALGTLYIGGDGVAHGYIGRPDLTNERFIPNPFDASLGRIYNTGDQARWLADGRLECLGRIDHQVKIRGFRIELGEIEAALAAYPGVRHAVVMVREDRPGDQQLVGYVVADPPPVINDLRAALRERLPAYMIPSAFVTLAAMPLTPNGKVNRLALPVPEEISREDIPFVAPRTPVEEGIAAVWADVLNVEHIGVYDNFFDLGGHSLKATQVTARLRDVFNVDVPVRLLLDQPNLLEFAKTVEVLLHGAGTTKSESQITLVSREGKVPLSFAQERMWIIDQMMSTGAAYNISAAIRLKGHLNIDALERSLSEIIRRHEVLRTAYYGAEGGVEQKIAAPAPVSIPVQEIDTGTAVEQEAQIQAWLRQEAQHIFNLAEGSLLRARLLRLSEDNHIIILNMHHIVSDGWSMGVLVREFTTLYAAYVAGKASPLPELPIQYADFAAWQRQALSDEGLAEDVAYWKGRLGGNLPVLTLPTNRPRPAIQTFSGATHTFELSPQIIDDLKRLSRREKVTLFMILMAAFKVLMWRYTGQEDVIVGTPIANRQRAQIEGLVGFFVNTLALRTDLSGDPSFAELVKRVREIALGAYAHQNMPFEKLVEVLKPERSLSYSPIFQVMFILQNAPLGLVELPELTVEPVNVDVGASKFDLTLTLYEADKGMIGQLEYNTDLFDESTIKQLERHFTTLLESIIAQPQVPISALPLLTPEERQHILVDWNRTQVDYPQHEGVHQLFEAQAERTPDATALIFEGKTLTYRQLNQRANQLAHYLRGLSVTPDTLVGICMERSLEMLIALLGVLKAGGAYVPMDPEYPQERLGYMVEDARMPIILTQQKLIERLPNNQAQMVCIDSDWEKVEGQSQDNPAPQQTGDNLAYVIFTSGSTGRPKGVQIPHRALTNFLLSTQREPGMNAHDVLVSVTTLSFDIAGLELYLPLISGAAVAIASRDAVLDGVALAALLDSTGATVMQATPATWRMMIDSGWQGRAGLKMLCGGEGLPRKLMDQLLERGQELWNMYGPTETTIWSTVAQLHPDDPIISIGRPMANTQVYVLDNHLALVPAGAIGTLYIGGDGLARGYIGRPDLTDERFIPNPFDASLGRIYNTGDQARWLPDGRLECLGRADHQVKVRGFRIELGEIESVLANYPGVRQAVVVLREDRPGDQQLVAYVVANPAPSINDMRGVLRQHLPAYMVPSTFVTLDKLPLTPNGKIDRRALPAPDQKSKVARQDALVAARSPMEVLMVEVWQEVLGIDQVSVYDNFFDLGGHSLKAMEVISKLEGKSGLRINPAFMRLQTLGQLASSYEELKTQSPALTPKPEPADAAGLGKRLLKGLFQRGNES